MNPEPFRFKKFSLAHHNCAHKIGTDGVLIGSWLKASNPKTILDIGSGSGLISFMMAQRFPDAQITGIELDVPSFKQSLENLENSPWKDRIRFINSNFLEHYFGEQSFDLIVSNPPFFKQAYLSGKSARDKARHEFSLPHKQLINRCKQLASEKANIALVLPIEEAENIRNESSFINTRTCKVRNKPSAEIKRFLMQFENSAGPLENEELSIRNNDNSFSLEYQNLTKDFYLNF